MTALAMTQRSAPRALHVALGGLARAVRARATAIAIAGLAASVASLGLDLFLWAGQRFAAPPVSFTSGPLPMATQLPMALAYASVGALLTARRPRNLIGWLFLFIGLTSSISPAVDLLVGATAGSFTAPSRGILAAAWLESSFHLPALCASLILVFLRFPDGRVPSGRWGAVGWLAVGAAGLTSLGLAIHPHGLMWYPSLPNPFAGPPSITPIADGLIGVGLGAVLLALALSSVSMVVRYRHCTPIQRRALRWILASMALLAVTGGAFLLARYGPQMGLTVSELLLVATLASAGLLPVAAGAGILRHHAFGIDVLLNRALVYIPMTAFLTGLYAASVALFQRIFIAVTGDTSDIAVVLTTLTLASAFQPLKGALERAVDRRFKPHSATEDPKPAAPSHDATKRLVFEVARMRRRMVRLEADLEKQAAALGAANAD